MTDPRDELISEMHTALLAADDSFEGLKEAGLPYSRTAAKRVKDALAKGIEYLLSKKAYVREPIEDRFQEEVPE